MRVDYNKKNNTFVIECNAFEMDYVRRLPNRKYSKRKDVWTAPCVRFNAQYIKDNWLDKNNIQIADEANSAITNVLEAMSVNIVPFPKSYPFIMKPRDYQMKALDYTYNLNLCFFDMATGSGKSKTAIDKISQHYIERKIKKVMIVCPCSIRHVWLKQFNEHCPVKYEICIADPKTAKSKKDIEIFLNTDTYKLKVLIVGIESLQLETSKAMNICKKFLNETNEVAVVVDEAHDIKNPTAKRTKNLISITRNTKYRIVMTGTPISQSIVDLFGLFEFLDNNIIGIGDYFSFKRRYTIEEDVTINSKTFRRYIGPKNIDELMQIIKPFTYQVTKEEAAKELPPKVYMQRYVTMTKEQEKVYKDIQQQRYAEIEDMKNENAQVVINHVLAAYNALQQVVGGFITKDTGEYNNSGQAIRESVNIVAPTKNPKIIEIKKVIDELPDNEQVIIWCKYRHECFMLAEELYNYKTDRFTQGAVTYLDKDIEQRQQIQKHMDEKSIRYFISTPNSGATGLTMNTVAYVIYYSNSTRLLYREQSEDRNHRIGQENNKVTYIDIIHQNSVDEKINESLSSKKDLADYVKSCLEKQDKPF
jgi:SNF2 family DNA or RNA helicase